MRVLLTLKFELFEIYSYEKFKINFDRKNTTLKNSHIKTNYFHSLVFFISIFFKVLKTVGIVFSKILIIQVKAFCIYIPWLGILYQTIILTTNAISLR